MADSRRRCRKPWYRPRNVVLAILLLIVLVIAWTFVETWQVYTDDPGADVDYREIFTTLCESRQPEGEDGWAELAALLEQLSTAWYDARREARLAGGDREAADDAAFDAMRQLLYQGGLLDDLRDALARPRFVRSWRFNGMLMNELLPLISPARKLEVLLAERMQRAAHGGRWTDVLDSLRLGMRLGEVTARQPSTIHYIVGAAIQTAILREVGYILTEHDVSPAIAAEIGVLAAGFGLPPVEYAIEVGRLDMQSILQSTHGSGGYALPLRTLFDEVVTSGGLVGRTPIDPVNDERSLLRAAISRWYFTTRAENGVLADQWYEALKARAEEPFATRWDDWPSPDILEAIHDRRHAVLTYFIYSPERLVDQPDLLAVDRAATGVMAAIEQYQADQGDPPDALQELVPDYLADAPWDPLHSGPFGYRLVDNDPYGRMYLLYSYGPDGIDDGGTEDPEYPTIARMREASGVDIILNPSRTDGSASD